MNVATLNIWQKFGPWLERMPRLVLALRELDADIVGLQEVRKEAEFDQLAILARECGYHCAFGAVFDDGFGLTGNGILSRFPIARTETIALPAGRNMEWRCLVFAEIDAPCGKVPFFTTHLNWRLDDGATRREQTLAIVNAIEARVTEAHYPAVLVGDFNAEPDSDEMRFMRGLTDLEGKYVYYADAWVFAGEGKGTTYSKSNPFAETHRESERRIDYVYVRSPVQSRGEPLTARVVCNQMLDGMFPTDHYGVAATLGI
jgi:endonuclease/exonuclease/phosphatase family metal-dependent hydrolase